MYNLKWFSLVEATKESLGKNYHRVQEMLAAFGSPVEALFLTQSCHSQFLTGSTRWSLKEPPTKTAGPNSRAMNQNSRQELAAE